MIESCIFRTSRPKQWYPFANVKLMLYHFPWASIASPTPATVSAVDWYTREGFVYFVAAGSICESCKSIKIGVSTCKGLLQRLRGIQSSNHTRIRLLAVMTFGTMLEAEQRETELHRQFSGLARVPRMSLGYEWFKASPDLMEFIEESTKALGRNLRVSQMLKQSSSCSRWDELTTIESPAIGFRRPGS